MVYTCATHLHRCHSCCHKSLFVPVLFQPIRSREAFQNLNHKFKIRIRNSTCKDTFRELGVFQIVALLSWVYPGVLSTFPYKKGPSVTLVLVQNLFPLFSIVGIQKLPKTATRQFNDIYFIPLQMV